MLQFLDTLSAWCWLKLLCSLQSHPPPPTPIFLPACSISPSYSWCYLLERIKNKWGKNCNRTFCRRWRSSRAVVYVGDWEYTILTAEEHKLLPASIDQLGVAALSESTHLKALKYHPVSSPCREQTSCFKIRSDFAGLGSSVKDERLMSKGLQVQINWTHKPFFGGS